MTRATTHHRGSFLALAAIALACTVAPAVDAASNHSEAYYEQKKGGHYYLSSHHHLTHEGVDFNVGLYLHRDQTFQLEYQELGSSRGGGRIVAATVVVRGRWRTAGESVLLGEYGKLTATGAKKNGKPTFTFELRKAMHSKKATGATGTIAWTRTSAAPCKVRPDLRECSQNPYRDVD